MNLEKGGYLIKDSKDDDTLLFIYMKLSKTQLANALPISFDSNSYDTNNSQYISAIFKNGQDFIGQTNFSQVQQTIQTTTHIDLINNNLQTCQNLFPNLTSQQYHNLLSFATNQLNIDVPTNTLLPTG